MAPTKSPQMIAMHKIVKQVNGTGTRPMKAGNPWLKAHATQTLFAALALFVNFSQNLAAMAPLLNAEFSIASIPYNNESSLTSSRWRLVILITCRSEILQIEAVSRMLIPFCRRSFMTF